jgi:predicted secreted acid phosphatase/endonuclease/exonuclease/phosphatase family metal-dependent hydrolase
MLNASRCAIGCAAALLTALASAELPNSSREQLNAVLWMQRAPEYRAIALQTWRLATERLHTAAQLGSAAIEQESMPTAALEFVSEALERGHKVFYLTNRDCLTVPKDSPDPCPQLTATMRNLDALGFPNARDSTNYLLQGSRAEWAASSKTLRRQWISERYRILMLIGDDLGDFVEQRVYAARRDELSQRFGTRWFALPNAMYGSWDRAYADTEAKYAALETEGLPPALAGSRDWSAGQRHDIVRVATWNVEYLITPASHAAMKDGCEERGDAIRSWERRIPCAIARRPARAKADFAALQRYATRLDADVVALQEVDGPEAAVLVFPGYEFCFSTRAHVQKNGFAIRRGLPHRCEEEYLPLSLGDEQRRGVVVTLFPESANEITLMSVHLKSGCPEGPLTAPGRNCELLRESLAPLEAWVESQAKARKRFAVLGDFNRRFSLEKGPSRDPRGNIVQFMAELNDGEPAASRLVDVTAGRKFVGCTRSGEFTEYIDTVLLGRDLARSALRNGFVRVTYDETDVGAVQLSDHCPVGIDLRLSSGR